MIARIGWGPLYDARRRDRSWLYRISHSKEMQQWCPYNCAWRNPFSLAYAVERTSSDQTDFAHIFFRREFCEFKLCVGHGSFIERFGQGCAFERTPPCFFSGPRQFPCSSPRGIAQKDGVDPSLVPCSSQRAVSLKKKTRSCAAREDVLGPCDQREQSSCSEGRFFTCDY